MEIRGPVRPDLMRQECLADLLAATASERPDQPAIIWGQQVITYAALAEQSGRIARALRRRGAGPGSFVGLSMPRGADLLIAQAGITKSGAAWLPFDAGTPKQRVATCLQASKAIGLLTSRTLSGEAFEASEAFDECTPSWAMEDLLADKGDGVENLPLANARPDDPAYVIYTSGSTGTPKGIVVTHRSICHFLRSENDVLGVRCDDRVYQGFSAAFDMWLEEVWIAYLAGATLWVAPADLVVDPQRVAAAIVDHRLTVLHAVPTLIGLIEHDLPGVRLMNLGGEACPDALAQRLARPGRRVFNTYGPTEATVSASIVELDAKSPVTIGKPLPNYGLVVVNEAGLPLPHGEDGEIGIFGPGVAVGYLGRPDLTAQRFVRNPVAIDGYDARLYLTGDLGRIDSDGQMHYLGRADGQVKIRGFRVELGEIEAALAAQPEVAAAAVVLRPIADVEQLVALIVTGNGCILRSAELRKALQASLPPYMVPALYVFVDQLPRLISGKVDRKTLKTQEIVCTLLDETDTFLETPANEDETALHETIVKLFPGQPWQPDADFFFDLGGHSLLVARLVSLLRENANYASMSVQDVYCRAKLKEISVRMTDLRGGLEQAAQARQALPPRYRSSALRRFVCGAAQTAAIPFLVLLKIAPWLFPFFIYHYNTGDEGDSVLLAVTLSISAYVATEAAMFFVAIAGKWLIVGRQKAGRYPLWGFYYFRCWLADKFLELPSSGVLTGTPMLRWYLRALGATIGRDVDIDSMSVAAPDLLTIDDGASIGASVHCGNARVERGMFIVGPVHIGREAVVDSYTLFDENTSVGAAGRLGGLSALAAGKHVPAGEYWEGAPARRVDRQFDSVPPRPTPSRVVRYGRAAFFVVASYSVAALFFLTVFPAFMLMDWIDERFINIAENGYSIAAAFGIFFAISIPASMLLVVVTALLASGMRRLLLRRQQPGISSVYSFNYLRKWLIARILDESLSVLHGLYASVYAPTWFRLMGARVGRDTEISTVAGIVPDLLSLGEHSFVADGVLLGDEELRGGWMILKPTEVGNRSFIGNGSYVADGAIVPDGVLVGVQTRTPDNNLLQSGQTWIGSPAILLPAREQTSGFDPSLTFFPSWRRRLCRASIEALRLVLPLAFVIASGYSIVQVVLPMAEVSWLRMIAALGCAGFIYGLASFLLVVALKWTLVGRYRPNAMAMWTPEVWLTEAVTSVYESLAVPNLLAMLCGTPLLPWALRLLGVRIGRGCYFDTTDITEFDCVQIGDEAELNSLCGPQTHLFEDRVMKIGHVVIGDRVTVGAGSTILYNTRIGNDVGLGPMTLVAKGEELPPGSHWEGSPAAPTS